MSGGERGGHYRCGETFKSGDEEIYDTTDEDVGGVDQFSICKGRHKVALSKHLAYGTTGAAILPSSVLLLFLFPSASSVSHSRPSFILPPPTHAFRKRVMTNVAGRTMLFGHRSNHSSSTVPPAAHTLAHGDVL